jgi:hypothetical protein
VGEGLLLPTNKLSIPRRRRQRRIIIRRRRTIAAECHGDCTTKVLLQEYWGPIVPERAQGALLV